MICKRAVLTTQAPSGLRRKNLAGQRAGISFFRCGNKKFKDGIDLDERMHQHQPTKQGMDDEES
jgi:hypothetical protein